MSQFYLRADYLFRCLGENVFFFFNYWNSVNTMAIEKLLLGIIQRKKLNEYKQHSKVTKYLKQPYNISLLANNLLVDTAPF